MKLLKILFSIAAIVTILLPTDLLPDIIPFVGWLDDVLAAGFLLRELLDLIRSKRNPTN